MLGENDSERPREGQAHLVDLRGGAETATLLPWHWKRKVSQGARVSQL